MDGMEGDLELIEDSNSCASCLSTVETIFGFDCRGQGLPSQQSTAAARASSTVSWSRRHASFPQVGPGWSIVRLSFGLSTPRMTCQAPALFPVIVEVFQNRLATFRGNLEGKVGLPRNT